MRRWAVLAVMLAAACNDGGNDGGGGGPTGGAVLTVSGANPLSATNFAAVTQTATCDLGSSTLGAASVFMIASDQGGICGYLQGNKNKASARSIVVVIVRIDPTSATAAVTPGDYPIATSLTGTETQLAVVISSTNDDKCNSDDDAATSGTVTVTSTADGRVQGTVNAMLQSGATVTGTFDAEDCAATFTGDVCMGQIGPQGPECAP